MVGRRWQLVVEYGVAHGIDINEGLVVGELVKLVLTDPLHDVEEFVAHGAQVPRFNVRQSYAQEQQSMHDACERGKGPSETVSHMKRGNTAGRKGARRASWKPRLNGDTVIMKSEILCLQTFFLGAQVDSVNYPLCVMRN